MLKSALPVIALTMAVTACGPGGPPTRATAERLCAPEARQADGISGRVGVGGGSDGPFAGGNVTITSDILNPRDEQEAFEACIERRLSGQPEPRNSGLTVGISLGGST